MTGYTADYIGQLIRSGKLSGKQVFSNVAWVTTREAVLEYTRDKKGKQVQEATLVEKLLSPEALTSMFKVAGWFVAGILFIVILLFVDIFAVSIDHKINATYLDKQDHAI